MNGQVVVKHGKHAGARLGDVFPAHGALDGISGGQSIPLTFSSSGPGAGVFEKFPTLRVAFMEAGRIEEVGPAAKVLTYPDSERWALRGVTFRLRPGERIAITLAATALYLQDGLQALRKGSTST